jgi:GNAT superfamily N-acetyltransferase
VSVRIYSKFAKDLTLLEEKACAKMVSSGAIYNVFVECCKPENPPNNQVFIAKEGDKFIGWAIIKFDKKRKWQFMVYVKQLYRRQKIGTNLYKRAKKFFRLKDKEILVYRTNNSNTKFFDNIKKEGYYQ